MFLKRLYNYNKFLCGFFVAFILAFIFLNYKQGLVFTPIYQYGMYSEKMHVSDTVNVYRFYINDKQHDYSRFNAAAYSFAERDMMYVSLDNYLNSSKVNTTVFSDMKRILSKAGAGGLMNSGKYENRISDADFMIWYKGLLGHITGEDIQLLEIYDQQFIWDDGRLKPVSEMTTIF